MTVAFLSGTYSPLVTPGPAALRPAPHCDEQDRERRSFYVADELDSLLALGGRKRIDLLLTHDWPAGLVDDTAAGPVGDPNIRMLVERVQAKVSCHGNRNRSLSASVEQTSVACLGGVLSGAASVGIFCRRGGRITRLG